MWDPDYAVRLKQWHDLRQRTHCLDLEVAMLAINNWWWQAPMVNQSLHWEDFPAWPDPWRLLHLSGFCDLARALGMLYTVILSDLESVPAQLIQIPGNNLVSVDSAKYILNWSPGQIVNNLSPDTIILQTVDRKILTKSMR